MSNRVPVIRLTPVTEIPLNKEVEIPLNEGVDIPDLTPDEEYDIIIPLSVAGDFMDEILSIALGDNPTSLLSQEGYTMDTYIIANTASMPVRGFWEAGKLNPRAENETQGIGPEAIPVTTYYADFTDRDRTIIITEETYRVMIEGGEPHNEAPTVDGVERIQTNMEPISADRQSSQEQAVDGHGRVKPYRDDTRFPARTPE